VENNRFAMNKLTVVLLLLAVIGCGGKSDVPTAGASAPVKVTTATPVRTTLAQTIELPGQVEAFEETAVMSKLAGFIERLPVDLGKRVKGPEYDADGKLKSAGDILAELSVPELDQEFKQKEALVSQAIAESEQAAAGVKVAQAAVDSAKALVREAESGVKRAEANFERWEAELKRLADLAGQGAVTPKVVDETRNQAKAFDAARDEANAKLASTAALIKEAEARADKAKADERAATAKVDVAQADLKRVEALLGYTKIRAPFDGVVSGRHVHTGHLVQAAIGSAGTPLFTVTRIDKVRVFIEVPEAQVAQVEREKAVVIRRPAAGNKTLPAEQVAATAWVLEPKTRTLKIEIDLDNAGEELRPGMYIAATLTLQTKPDVLTIPTTAVLKDGTQTYCYAVEQGKIARKNITTGLRVGTVIEVSQGLGGNEEIVGVTPAVLQVGQAVEINQPAAKK